MASDIKVQVAGLHRSNNPFSTAPPGSLSRADNCVLNATNVLECRRGFDFMAYTFGTGSDRAKALTWYGSTLLVQYASKLCRDTGAAFSDYTGTFAAVDATLGRMRFATCAGNLYFNCSDGTRALDAVAGTPTQAGVPKALRTNAYSESSNGWLAHNAAVAYRHVWGIVDANGNEKLGAPSPRKVAVNRLFMPAGQMVRTGGATVTVTPTGVGSALYDPMTLQVGDVITLSPGEANFVAGNKVVASVSIGGFTYAEAGANVSNTATQEAQITRRQTVTLYFPPSGITTSHFFRIYRSEATSSADTPPSDELYLCYEGKPSGGDIAAGFVAVSDICPEDFLGDAAPWNSNGGYGLPQANERPPIALDLAYWDSRLFYANCTQRHRLFLNVLGVGSPAGIQNNDTLTLAGTTFTFKTAAGAWPEVSIVSSFTPSVNIEMTARGLVAAINGSVSAVRAYYVSGTDDPTGKLLIEETDIGGAAFTAATSRATAFSPALTRSSDNNRRANGILFSKAGEPEAVPVVNEVLVGSQNDPILRILPLKGTLVCFKQREGIWAVTGSNGRYSAEQIGVANLLASESPRAFSDRVWCLTDQGETTVTEGAGVGVTSYNIDTDIIGLFGDDTLALVKAYAFGIAYESDRRYMLWLPSALGDTYGTQCFNYSTGTKTFTRWTKPARCGGVNPVTDKLTLGAATTNKILVERKAFSYFDYVDEKFTATISSVSGATVTFNTTSHGVEVGAVLNSGGFNVGGDYPAYVTAVNGANVTMSFDYSSSLPASGSVDVYPAIACEVRWQPVTGGNPALLKMGRQLTVLFGACTAAAPVANFSSELDAAESPVTLTLPSATLLGSVSVAKPVRVAPLPPAHSEAAQLTVGLSVCQAFASFKVHGFVLDYEIESEKGGKR